MEEVAVRANMALEHKNFMNHFESNYGSADAEKLEHQYDEICAQVDKITLKLLFKKIEGAKLEAALDLVHRLHLEKSFEIAMDVADRSRHRKLSDKIYAIMEEKFNSKEDDDDGSIDDESYNGSITAFARNQDFDKRGINVSPEAAEDSNQNRNPKYVQFEERPKSRKRINPFATNTKKSPGKSLTKSPAPKKPMLSRLSSFSSESRRVNKASKEIL